MLHSNQEPIYTNEIFVGVLEGIHDMGSFVNRELRIRDTSLSSLEYNDGPFHRRR